MPPVSSSRMMTRAEQITATSNIARLRAQGDAQAALTAAALAFFVMEFEGAPHPPAEQVRADFAVAVHGYRAAVAR